VRTRVENEKGELVNKVIETSVGRILFNKVVPEKVGFINELLTKKALRDIIARILTKTDVPTTAQFLDDIKNLGYSTAFRGGLSFSLGDITVPEAKEVLIKRGQRRSRGHFWPTTTWV